MPDRNLTEVLLTRSIGAQRAAAIAGDLLELASTRGKLWYFVASAKTVLSITWKLPVAFLMACMGFILVQRLTWALYPFVLPVLLQHPFLAEILGRIAWDLTGLAAFAGIRYGIHDRLFKLSCAAFAIATLTYVCLHQSLPVPVLAVLGSLAAVGLLVSTKWRGAFLLLTLAVVVGLVMDFNFGNLAHLYCWLYDHKPLNASSHYRYFDVGYAFPHTIFWIVTWTISVLDVLTLCFVTSHFRRFIVPPANRAELAEII
jgi:hypothetical protein